MRVKQRGSYMCIYMHMHMHSSSSETCVQTGER